MDFNRVLVTDRLAWEIFSAASREKLLFVRQLGDRPVATRRGTARQRALSLLVLFDRLVIHEYGDVGGRFRLPDLEKEGIVEIIPEGEFPKNVPLLKTEWRKRGVRRAFSKRALQHLSLIQQLRPLIINRMLESKGDDFASVLANHFGGSRRKYLNLFFDCVLAFHQGDLEAVRDTKLRRILPPDLLLEILKQLLEGPDLTGEGSLTISQATFVCALMIVQEIAVIQALSTKLELGVATEYYGEKFRSESALTGKELDAVAAANQFLLLRAAFADEGQFLPRIEGIKHALLLRRDPHLKAVREQLKLFHEGLTTGDRNAVFETRREIQKARQRLRHRSAWDKGLRWLAYLSVPVGIAESLIGGLPIAGTSLSIIGGAGAAASRRIEKKNAWVLFGS